MSAHIQRAELLVEQGRHELAEQELRRALQAEPNDAYAHALLAHCLVEREQFEEATAEARQAIHLRPDFAYAHYTHALVLYHRNRFDESLLAIREAERIDPENADFCALEAGILLDTRKWRDALVAADRGLQLDAEHTGCTNLRAMALVKLGRRVEAGEAIEGALAKNPEDSTTHANHGWSLVQSGDPAQALHHFQEALRLDPTNQWAREGIVEALKAGNPLYALILKYFFFMARLSSGAQWGIILAGYFGNRILAGVARSNPALAPWVLPVRILYLVFVFLTWTAQPLSNLLLRLNRFGRLALTREQIVASNWVGACVGLAILAFLGFLFTGRNALLGQTALGLAALIIPVAGTFSCAEGWPRRVMGSYTAVLALLGAAALVAQLSGPVGRQLSAIPGLLFLVGVIGAPWLANFLALRRPTR